MGQQRQLVRQVLGRSHDLPPDWDALQDLRLYALVSAPGQPPLYQCIDETNEQSYMLTFDEKGRPYSPKIAKLEEDQANTVDFVTRYAVKSERKPVISKFVEDLDGSLEVKERHAARRRNISRYISRTTTFGLVILDTYWSSVVARVLTRRSFEGAKLSQLIASDVRDVSYLISLSTAVAARMVVAQLRPFVFTFIARRVNQVLWTDDASKLITFTNITTGVVLSPVRWIHDLGFLHLLPTYGLFTEPSIMTLQHNVAVASYSDWVKTIGVFEAYSALRGFRATVSNYLKTYLMKGLSGLRKVASRQMTTREDAVGSHSPSPGKIFDRPYAQEGYLLGYFGEERHLDPSIQNRMQSYASLSIDHNVIESHIWQLPLYTIAIRMAAQVLVHQLHARRCDHAAEVLHGDLWRPSMILTQGLGTSSLTTVGLAFALKSSTRCGVYLLGNFFGIYAPSDDLWSRNMSLHDD